MASLQEGSSVGETGGTGRGGLGAWGPGPDSLELRQGLPGQLMLCFEKPALHFRAGPSDSDQWKDNFCRVRA